MPIHDANRAEHIINSGLIRLSLDEGQQVPAYWAHPTVGRNFPALALLHDWWGLNAVSRLLANFFAQMGYYVIVPDLFDGKTARTAREAMALLEATEDTRYNIVNTTLGILEHHHHSNNQVAVFGLGMGGSLAFEAALRRDDLEAAVACAGFPHRFIKQLDRANTPILAFYGSEEPYVKKPVIETLRHKMAQTPLADQHRVVMIEGAGHEFFSENPDPALRQYGRVVVNETLQFLEQHLDQPDRPARYSHI